MMYVDELKRRYPTLEVLKEYPDSGQKKVYLVNIDNQGKVILKIVKKMDDRIQREIDIVNQNSILGVPKVLEFSSIEVENGVVFYIIEEFIDGDVLSTLLQQGSLEINRCLLLFESLLVIVAKLESCGIVHRDIKPDNIICARAGSYHLIDFGIARSLNLSSLTLTEALVGPHTPGYGAPELFQYNKALISSKADLFSVGVVMYQAIFGEHPFVTGKEADLNEIWYRTVTVQPRSYHITGDTDSQLIGLIQTLMQKQASKRPPSAKRALEWFYAMRKTLTM